jgi:hypothetical protein
MKTNIQNVVSDLIWTTMIYLFIYLFIYLQTSEPRLGLIQIGGDGCFGFQTCLLQRTEISLWDMWVRKAELEDI